jgi:hypothetical protein
MITGQDGPKTMIMAGTGPGSSMITAAALAFPRLRASVTSMSGQCDAPVWQTAVTCNDAIRVTIYSCRNRSACGG